MLTKRKLEERILILEREVMGKLNKENPDAKYYYDRYSLRARIDKLDNLTYELNMKISKLLEYLGLEYVEKINEFDELKKFIKSK